MYFCVKIGSKLVSDGAHAYRNIIEAFLILLRLTHERQDFPSAFFESDCPSLNKVMG